MILIAALTLEDSQVDRRSAAAEIPFVILCSAGCAAAAMIWSAA